MPKISLILGDGRGKTSTAIGHSYLRSLKDKKITIVQFLKTGKECGECNYLSKNSQIQWFHFGKKEFYVSENQKEEFRELINQGLLELTVNLNQTNIDILVLDELGVTIKYGLLSWTDLEEIIKGIKEEIIITGRTAPSFMRSIADEIIFFREIKHPFKEGILARKGIDF